MTYAVKWTEVSHTGNRIKRELTMQLKETAIVMLNRIIIDCHHYDAVLVVRK